jgi:ureidoacrylate peracid hydrolase
MTNTALIIVDLQNAFCAEDGALERRGDRIIDLDGVLDSVNTLVRFAHVRSWPVIFTRVVLEQNAAASSSLYRRLEADGHRHRAYAPDARDAQIVEIPSRLDEDTVIDKAGYDPFYETDLERMLHAWGVAKLLVGGVLTNVCVESCVRSAFERGFEVTVIEEATSSYTPEAKAASLASIQRGFGEVLTMDRLANDERVSDPTV